MTSVVHIAVNQCLSPGTITMFFRRYIVCCRTHTFIIQLTTTHMSPDEQSIFLEIVVASSKQWQNSQTFHGLLGATDQTVWHFKSSNQPLPQWCVLHTVLLRPFCSIYDFVELENLQLWKTDNFPVLNCNQRFTEIFGSYTNWSFTLYIVCQKLPP